MKENLYEANLRKALSMSAGPGCVRPVGDSFYAFSQLMKRFPVLGSKIDWDHVPGSIKQLERAETLQLQRFTSFFDEMVQKFHLSGDVIYVGDSATDFALAGSINCIRSVLTEVLAIPQHHYFIGPDFTWCMCFTMEGNMDFGMAPASTNNH